ncbi:unnamed protein product [Darwinula stevensoni]|uniref:Uncharacterized protein n=1 Tax=Darwinula stevensoni TaxID=69355 RepID=A0A7R9AEM7_9CRUS|nr:unnamed protein product [Darwinula stevensoni]CAG0902146.1 unnamed protein product [Darwinula stevensoni]
MTATGKGFIFPGTSKECEGGGKKCGQYLSGSSFSSDSGVDDLSGSTPEPQPRPSYISPLDAGFRRGIAIGHKSFLHSYYTGDSAEIARVKAGLKETGMRRKEEREEEEGISHPDPGGGQFPRAAGHLDGKGKGKEYKLSVAITPQTVAALASKFNAMIKEQETRSGSPSRLELRLVRFQKRRKNKTAVDQVKRSRSVQDFLHGDHVPRTSLSKSQPDLTQNSPPPPPPPSPGRKFWESKSKIYENVRGMVKNAMKTFESSKTVKKETFLNGWKHTTDVHKFSPASPSKEEENSRVIEGRSEKDNPIPNPSFLWDSVSVKKSLELGNPIPPPRKTKAFLWKRFHSQPSVSPSQFYDDCHVADNPKSDSSSSQYDDIKTESSSYRYEDIKSEGYEDVKGESGYLDAKWMRSSPHGYLKVLGDGSSEETYKGSSSATSTWTPKYDTGDSRTPNYESFGENETESEVVECRNPLVLPARDGLVLARLAVVTDQEESLSYVYDHHAGPDGGSESGERGPSDAGSEEWLDVTDSDEESSNTPAVVLTGAKPTGSILIDDMQMDRWGCCSQSADLLSERERGDVMNVVTSPSPNLFTPLVGIG